MKSGFHKQRGFTLVEMAIVVVLGGILLAAGLAGGRGLISRSQTQDVIQIITDLQTAATSFNQRFGYLPGDWIYTANQLPGVTTGGTGGTTGNGVIQGSIAATGLATAANEVGVAPGQLYAAGLISKLGTNPQMRVRTQFGAVHMVGAATAAPTYFATNPAVTNVVVLYNLPCEVALEVDRALDNGNLASGRAMGELATCQAGDNMTIYSVPLQ